MDLNLMLHKLDHTFWILFLEFLLPDEMIFILRVVSRGGRVTSLYSYALFTETAKPQ
jgi:hypothetical protein